MQDQYADATFSGPVLPAARFRKLFAPLALAGRLDSLLR